MNILYIYYEKYCTVYETKHFKTCTYSAFHMHGNTVLRRNNGIAVYCLDQKNGYDLGTMAILQGTFLVLLRNKEIARLFSVANSKKEWHYSLQG